MIEFEPLDPYHRAENGTIDMNSKYNIQKLFANIYSARIISRPPILNLERWIGKDELMMMETLIENYLESF
jgi:hypothetical protein